MFGGVCFTMQRAGFDYSTKVLVCARRLSTTNFVSGPIVVFARLMFIYILAPVYCPPALAKYTHRYPLFIIPSRFLSPKKTTPALPSSRRNILSCRAYILYIIILAHTNNNIISTFIGKSMFLSQSGIHNNNIIVLLYTQPNTHRTIRVVNVSHNII